MPYFNKSWLNRYFLMVAGLIAVALVALITVYTVTTEIALRNARDDLNKSLDEVTKSVSYYERYVSARSTRHLLSLKERAEAMRDCLLLSEEESIRKIDAMSGTQFIDGFVIFDGSGNVVRQSSKEAVEFWKQTLGSEDSVNLRASREQVSFMKHEMVNGHECYMAVVARDDAPGMIFVYNDLTTVTGIRMEVSDFLKDRYYRDDGMLFLTDHGGKIIFSADPKFEELTIQFSEQNQRTNDMAKLQFGDDTWYGMRRGYRSYLFYIFAPEHEVLGSRNYAMLMAISLVGVFVFMVLITLFLSLRKTRHKERKFQRTLATVTKLYETAIIYNALKNKWIAIKLPKESENLFSESKGIDEILKTVIRIFSTTEKKNEIMRFFDRNYLSARLMRGLHTVCEVEDHSGKWHCIRVEPCASSKTGEQGSFLLTVYSADLVHRKERELLAELQACMIWRKNYFLAGAEFMNRFSQSIKSSLSRIQDRLLASERAQGDITLVKQYHGQIQNQLTKMHNMMNSLTLLHKVKIGEIPLDNIVFDLCFLLQDVADAATTAGEKVGVKVIYIRNGERELMVRGSQLHLRQVLVHLTDNAIRYTPKGGSVQLRCRESFSCGHERWYEMSISDNGEGMSDEFQQHCFEVMAQEDPNAKNGLCGMGLGMAKLIIEQMSGCISVVSCKHVGTTFRLRLPFETVADNQRFAPNEPQSFAGRKVLLADDNEFDLELEEFALKDAGLEVVCIHSCKEALELYEKSAPYEFSMIFLDVAMLETDSFVVAQIIRNSSREDSLHIPVIAISPNAYTDDRGRCIEAGMNDCLSKPLNTNDLKKILIRYLTLA